MPVFILPETKPRASRLEVSPREELSPALPPEKFFSPICIKPFKNVPLVKITAFEWILEPNDVITPLILFFMINNSTTDS